MGAGGGLSVAVLGRVTVPMFDANSAEVCAEGDRGSRDFVLAARIIRAQGQWQLGTPVVLVPRQPIASLCSGSRRFGFRRESILAAVHVMPTRVASAGCARAAATLVKYLTAYACSGASPACRICVLDPRGSDSGAKWCSWWRVS